MEMPPSVKVQTGAFLISGRTAAPCISPHIPSRDPCMTCATRKWLHSYRAMPRINLALCGDIPSPFEGGRLGQGVIGSRRKLGAGVRKGLLQGQASVLRLATSASSSRTRRPEESAVNRSTTNRPRPAPATSAAANPGPYSASAGPASHRSGPLQTHRRCRSRRTRRPNGCPLTRPGFSPQRG